MDISFSPENVLTLDQLAKENLSESLRLCGNIEMEISNLNIDEQEDFLSIYNFPLSGSINLSFCIFCCFISPFSNFKPKYCTIPSV